MHRSIPILMAAVLVLSAPLAAQCAVTWSGQFGNTPIQAYSALAYDDGSGPALYFGEQGGVRRWRGPGTPFELVGTGSPYAVASLAVWNDGQGPALYATGYFTTAGGVTANGIAKWNGSTWSALGSGLVGNGYALAVYDDGSGSALYLAGISRAPAACRRRSSQNGTATRGRRSRRR